MAIARLMAVERTWNPKVTWGEWPKASEPGTSSR